MALGIVAEVAGNQKVDGGDDLEPSVQHHLVAVESELLCWIRGTGESDPGRVSVLSSGIGDGAPELIGEHTGCIRATLEPRGRADIAGGGDPGL